MYSQGRLIIFAGSRGGDNCLLAALARGFSFDQISVLKNASGFWDAFRTSLKDLAGPGIRPGEYILKNKIWFGTFFIRPSIIRRQIGSSAEGDSDHAWH
jgi:hypothetical protein